MAYMFDCSSCRVNFIIGSYHGNDGWCNGLYCRHCGAGVLMVKPFKQFLSSFWFGWWKSTCYKLKGRVRPTKVRIRENARKMPQVRCACGAKGPLGPDGPLIDRVPEGYVCKPISGRFDTEAMGICPGCKQQTLHCRGEFRT